MIRGLAQFSSLMGIFVMPKIYTASSLTPLHWDEMTELYLFQREKKEKRKVLDLLFPNSLNSTT